MKKGISVFFALMIGVVGCDDVTSSSHEDVMSNKVDTLVIKDTTIVSKLDTMVLSKQDTLVQKDTVVLSKKDTLVKKDTLIQKDTLIIIPQDTGKGILDFNPESSMIPILENLVHQKRDGSFSIREKQVVLLHFTDIHGHEENLKRIKEFYDHYSKYIDVVVHTGDAISDKWGDSFDFWTNAGASGFLNILGNHDVNFFDKNNNKVDVTQKQVYDRYFSPFVSEWGASFPQNVAEEGLMYYYKDIDKGAESQRVKIRLIALDEYYWDDKEKTWLENVLDDARTNGFAVIIFRHESSPIKKFDNCPFVSQETFKGRPLLDAETAVDNFISDGGEFVMWVGGHHHQDDVGVLLDHTHQLAFNGDIAALKLTTEWSDSWRKIGTKSQDCFTLIGIDRYEKVVRFVRVGADMDRYERKKESMAINYATMEMIN